ncbi:MAG: hypothetical protein HQM10_18685 [Candidatus Riflebacteria bacterium]|nr:hypothetical protein [Candidatus Riflebacteria bacterium]
MRNRNNRIKFVLVLISALIFGASSAVSALQGIKISRSGSDAAFIKPAPWSGYWWSRQDSGMVNALKKYDAFVEQKTGANPGAAGWEANPANGHYYRNAPSWAGHCNGWAAAAILEPEPKQPKVVDGITFSVGTQKAILSEMYMTCYNEFYGKRRDHNFPLSLDIRPDIFHRLLIENIKNKKRPMVADTSFNKPVWNYPIYGYETSWTKNFFIPGCVFVTTTVYFVDDGVRADYVGTKWFSKNYHYVLYYNYNKEVTGGIWNIQSLWDHPDFIWVPTADSAPYGTLENPKLTPDLVHAITNGRPNYNMNFSISSSDSSEDRNISVLREAGINAEEYFN